MAMYPDIQRRVQAEIDSVVPEGRLPSLQDRSKLVYTEAVMCEVFRWATILPFALAHAVSETFDYQGYTFPKKTLLLYNVWGVHRNPEVWNEPNRFNPERFLDTTGKINKNLTEHVIPFGVGKRLDRTINRDRYMTNKISFLFFLRDVLSSYVKDYGYLMQHVLHRYQYFTF